MHAYTVPETIVHARGSHCLIPVPAARVEELRDGLRFTREQALSFVSPTFHASAEQVFVNLHLPPITLANAWQTFLAMLPVLMLEYPERNPEPAYIFTL